MSAKIIAEDGLLKGLVFPFEGRTEWIIGRDPDESQIVLEDPTVSRKHCLCRMSPAGIIIENLSGTHPIKVNGEVVEAPRLLVQGDILTIGEGSYRFYAEEGAKVMNTEPDENQEFAMDKDETPHETVFGEHPNGDKGILAEIDFDLRGSGRWLLKVIGGPNNGAEFSMQEGHTYVIGTDPNAADVIFHDTSVSRQHARITIDKDGKLSIEDLNSRNGTQVDGEPIKGIHPVETNTLITMGTTSFIIFDREGEMHTIISPLLPSIVKVLQKSEEAESAEEVPVAPQEVAAPEPHEHKAHNALGAFLLIGILTGLFVVIGIGTATLFRSEPIQKVEIDHSADIRKVLVNFPNVSFTYNKKNGSLLLIGHVLTETDKNQLMYTVGALPYVKNIDDKGVIIDEHIWREINYLLSNRPEWKAITVHATKPGAFVISGYLKTRQEAQSLSSYVNANFPYPSLLTWNVIVEEDIINKVETTLDNSGFHNIKATLENGELTLSGGIDKQRVADFDKLVDSFKSIQGIRSVKNYVTEAQPEAAMINITGKYRVSGSSHAGGTNVSVVINGKILSKGDVLDGMTITDIKSNAVFLEKDGVKYRIDINP